MVTQEAPEEAWELISARAEAEPDESRVAHCHWCKCYCCVSMTKIKESPCCPEGRCCSEEGATGLQCVWMHDATRWSVCAWTRLSSM